MTQNPAVATARDTGRLLEWAFRPRNVMKNRWMWWPAPIRAATVRSCEIIPKATKRPAWGDTKCIPGLSERVLGPLVKALHAEISGFRHFLIFSQLLRKRLARPGNHRCAAIVRLCFCSRVRATMGMKTGVTGFAARPTRARFSRVSALTSWGKSSWKLLASNVELAGAAAELPDSA